MSHAQDSMVLETEGLLDEETLSASRAAGPTGEPWVPGLTLLFHPDHGRIGERAALTALAAGHTVELSRVTPLFSQPANALRRPLADPHLSRLPLRLAPGAEPGGARLLLGSCRAPIELDGTALTADREISAAEIERGVVLLLARSLALVLSRIDPQPLAADEEWGLVGASPPMLRLQREIRDVGPLSIPVLLRGPSGAGKELAARALHATSPRRYGPFVAVSLAAVPPSLAAAELFGAEKGAYTGAEPRRGRFALADGGTLFLDEVGEAPPEVQVLLLRALETRRIQAVGGQRESAVDVRVVAATDADLEAAIRDGRFRAPLLHRLRGYELRLPSLAARREDLGRLVLHGLAAERRELGEADWLAAPLLARLARHDWPGNVRELGNVLRQLAIRARRVEADGLLAELEGWLVRPEPSQPSRAASEAPRPEATHGVRPLYRDATEVGEEELRAALVTHRFRLQAVARALGVARGSLYDRIAKSGAARTAASLSPDEVAAAEQACAGDLERMAEHLAVSLPALRRRLRRLGRGG